jgi:cytochrome c oxidase assembly factor CtaG
MAAILLHGGVLYIGYLATYLVNGWLEWGTAPILVFTGIFVVGYLAIWAVICSVIRRRTAKLNEILKKKQQSTAEEG